MGKIIHNGQVYGGGSGGSSELAELDDVDVLGVVDGDALVYDDATSKWVPGTAGAVDDVEVNGTSVVDANKVAQIKSYKEVTQAEYNALPASKLSDDILYAIKDGGQAVEGFPPLIYSDEEREVGVWRDGKPLYQKTYTGTTNDTENILISDASFIDALVNTECDVKASSYYAQDGEYYAGYNDFTRVFITNNNSGNPKLYFNIGSSYPSRPATYSVTIWYTKVADTPGSGTWTTQGAIAHHYSTDEHIIGTWINGEPLYEKCIPLSNLIGGDNTIQHNISNLEKVVSVGGYIISNDTQTYNPIPCPSQALGWNARVRDITSTTFVFELGSEIVAYYSSGVAIFQYTKTTD